MCDTLGDTFTCNCFTWKPFFIARIVYHIHVCNLHKVSTGVRSIRDVCSSRHYTNNVSRIRAWLLYLVVCDNVAYDEHYMKGTHDVHVSIGDTSIIPFLCLQLQLVQHTKLNYAIKTYIYVVCTYSMSSSIKLPYTYTNWGYLMCMMLSTWL